MNTVVYRITMTLHSMYTTLCGMQQFTLVKYVGSRYQELVSEVPCEPAKTSVKRTVLTPTINPSLQRCVGTHVSLRGCRTSIDRYLQVSRLQFFGGRSPNRRDTEGLNPRRHGSFWYLFSCVEVSIHLNPFSKLQGHDVKE